MNAPDIAEESCRSCGGSGVNPESWADDALSRAYQRTDGAPGDRQADTLVAEIVRRGLDI